MINEPSNPNVRSHFDERSATYSGLYDGSLKSGAAFGFQLRREIVVGLAKNQEGSLLDCACGTGELTNSVVQNGNFDTVVANDFSESMLQHAKQNIEFDHGPLRFLNADVFSLADELAGEKFDCICCLGLLAHVGRLDGLLNMLADMLNPNGKLLLQSSLLNHIGVRITKLATSKRHERLYGYRQNFYTRKDILGAAEQAGLRCENIQRFTLGIPFGDKVAPRLNLACERGSGCFSSRWGAEAIFELRK